VFSRSKPPPQADVEAKLVALMRKLMPTADEDTARIVAACAGLFACVAYADRSYSSVEAIRLQELLKSIQGIGDEGAAAIAGVLGANMVEIATVHSVRFTRTLMELGDRDLRHQLLELLVEVAVADDRLTHDEVKVLRQLTAALGLEQTDYNAIQARHRDKLTVLQ
jgi:uncharacterized tellurite resistance protein B-like protein